MAAATAAGALAALAALLLAGCGGQRVSLARDVQPIFDSKCISCHPVSFPYLDLRRGRSYAQLVRAGATLAPAFERVVPGRPDLSYLLLHRPDPLRAHLLTAADRALLTRWIQEGAPK